MANAVDFGLVALFAIECALVAAALFAWRGIVAEKARIPELDAKVDAAKAAAAAAMQKANEVEGTHYRTLLKRIDEAEATAAQVDKKVTSLSGRVSALQRWSRDAGTAAEEPEGEGEMFIPEPPPPPSAAPGVNGRSPSFGKSIR